MKIKPAIRTQDEIDQIVSTLPGTWVKRRNARVRLTKWSNELVTEKIAEIKDSIRLNKSQGVKECDLRAYYADITELELKLLYNARL